MQVNDRSLPSGSDIAAELEELSALAESFASADAFVHTLEPGDVLLQTAWTCCTDPSHGPKVCWAVMHVRHCTYDSAHT